MGTIEEAANVDQPQRQHAGVGERLGRHAAGIAAVVVAAAAVALLDVLVLPGPVWLLPVLFLVVSVTIAVTYTVFPEDTARDVHVRAATQAASLSLVTYVTGWGFALPVVHLLGEADNLQAASTLRTRRTWWWGVGTTVVGQVGVVLGWLPSAVANVNATHGVAAFALLVSFFVRGRLRRAFEQQEHTRQEVVQLALQDDLTGLGNRAAILAALDEPGRGSASDDDRSPVLLHLNIDGFRTINDTLGHDVGDKVLRAAGKRIQGMLRSPDRAYRLSADNFGVVLHQAEDAEALAVAVRLVSGLDRLYRVDERAIALGVRCGITRVDPNIDAVGALRRADMAVTAIAADAENRIRHYDAALEATLTARLSLQQDLAQAVADELLHVHFQPLVNLADGAVVGAEALCRWNHPERGAINPGEFIPLAEQGGLIVRLGQRVLAQACEQMARWHEEFGETRFSYISVNVSMHQVRNTDMVADVASELARTGLHPSALTIEFTESALVDDPRTLIRVMEGLRALGVRLSVDDFGTGYSSLSYLDQLPVHVIKVDRAFLLSAQAGRRGLRLLESIIEMVQAMGLETVVEGIETVSDADLVRGLGGATAQGYLYGRPMAAGDLEALLRAAPTQPRRPRVPDVTGSAPPGRPTP